MVKSTDDVVHDFNEYVNMTADEIESFLKSDQSSQAGWSANDGSGESVGQQSGHKIVDILRRNPSKDAGKYTEEDKEHMRKVVAYCKRHLAQEGHMKETKTPEELAKTKSTISLKNWGHDPLKGSKGSSGGGKPASKKADKPVSKKAAPEKKEEPKAPEKSEKPTNKKAAPAEKPASKKADKPVSKKADKPASKKEDGAAGKKKADEADAGEKREAPAKAETSEKPASKKAKTAQKPVSEGSRKPPSRGAKEKK